MLPIVLTVISTVDKQMKLDIFQHFYFHLITFFKRIGRGDDPAVSLLSVSPLSWFVSSALCSAEVHLKNVFMKGKRLCLDKELSKTEHKFMFKFA